MDTNKLEGLIDDMKEPFIDEGIEYPDGVLEDRREYTKEDLQRMYSLTDEEADDLCFLVEQEFEPKGRLMERLQAASAEMLKECHLEGLHSSLDGWDSEHDRIVIQRYLADCCFYYESSKK